MLLFFKLPLKRERILLPIMLPSLEAMGFGMARLGLSMPPKKRPSMSLRSKTHIRFQMSMLQILSRTFKISPKPSRKMGSSNVGSSVWKRLLRPMPKTCLELPAGWKMRITHRKASIIPNNLYYLNPHWRCFRRRISVPSRCFGSCMRASTESGTSPRKAMTRKTKPIATVRFSSR